MIANLPKQPGAIAIDKLAGEQVIAVIRGAFGEHPEDIVTMFDLAVETLGWLKEIFDTIGQDAVDKKNLARIRRLAEIGSHLASERGELVAFYCSDLRTRLLTKGLIGTKREAQ